MGNDGGSIPKRRELVKEAARNPTTTEVKATQQEQQAHRWTSDPFSGDPLRKPIVSDCKGTLYNKDAVIEFLLPVDVEGGGGRLNSEAAKAEAEAMIQGAIKSLRDVVEVKFEMEDQVEGEGGPKYRFESEKWKCPITNEKLGPGARAVYLVPCGHAFAESVIKEIAGDKCLQCNETYAENDVIPILRSSEAEVKQLALRIKTLRDKGLTHSLKKAPGPKKRKKDQTVTAETNEVKLSSKEYKEKCEAYDLPNQNKPAERAMEISRKPKKSSSSSIKNPATASLTVKVLQEQEERNKRRKMDKNVNLEALFSKRDPKQLYAKNGDFMSRGFSIPTQSEK